MVNGRDDQVNAPLPLPPPPLDVPGVKANCGVAATKPLPDVSDPKVSNTDMENGYETLPASAVSRLLLLCWCWCWFCCALANITGGDGDGDGHECVGAKDTGCSGKGKDKDDDNGNGDAEAGYDGRGDDDPIGAKSNTDMDNCGK